MRLDDAVLAIRLSPQVAQINEGATNGNLLLRQPVTRTPLA